MAESISLQQLFAEELAAVNEMLDCINYLLEEALDPTDAEYTELHNERMMLEQTRLYFLARLEDRIPHPLIAS